MTTPSPDRGAVSVEPMTDRFDRLRDRAREAQALRHTWINVRVEDLTALLVHALPLARRYTGGPLEDGVYLFQRPTWDPVNWTSFGVAETVANPYAAPKLLAGEWVWLIGPLPIPPIPESEDQSNG